MRLPFLFLALTATLLLSTSASSAQEDVPVEVGDFYFCDSSIPTGECTTTIVAGDTVLWEYREGTAGHTVTECGDSCDSPTDSPVFDSGRLLAGDTFSFAFDQPGTYLYYCEFHPIAMRATIVVQPQPTPAFTTAPPDAPTPSPTASPSVTPSPAPTTTPTPEPTASPAPPAPDDDDDGGVSLLWFILGGSAALLAVAAAAVFMLRRARA